MAEVLATYLYQLDNVNNRYIITCNNKATCTYAEVPAIYNNLPCVLGSSAFQNATLLKTVLLPDNTDAIRTGCFSGCSSLERINIPESVTVIGNSAFEGCSSLKELIIPTSVVSIGQAAFRACTTLVDVTMLSTTPPTLVNIDAFTGTTCRVGVPSIAFEAYDNATNWRNVKHSSASLITDDLKISFIWNTKANKNYVKNYVKNYTGQIFTPLTYLKMPEYVPQFSYSNGVLTITDHTND